ncbi:MAG: beta-ketoacyl-ACP synthase [Myxococcota bacterium]
MSERRVVITGMGAVTPIGHTVSESFDALLAGRSGVRFMPEWAFMEDLQCRLGANVEDLDLKALYHRRVRRTMGRVALLALRASDEAIAQAGLTEEHLRSGRVGLTYGSTSGSSSELEEFSKPLMINDSMRGLKSYAYLRIMAHTCAANLASHYGIRGRVQPTCSACTSGSQAFGHAFELIQSGVADAMIAGGAEEMHYTTAVTFDLLMATTVTKNERPDEAPRPFDAARDGLVVGEGAATVVLEEREHALRRGAPILAEVLSYACTCDGGHLTQPDPEGMGSVMRLALDQAGLAPADVGYVNAHATGTLIGDQAEAQATLATFERPVPISSLKGHVGHTLGACGTLEAIWTVEMMRAGKLVGTRNLAEVHPACAGLGHLQEPFREARVDVAMSNNFAFGGINTSIVLGAPER